MKALTIPSIFKAVDKFSQPVDKMTKSAMAAMDRMERKMRRISQTAFSLSKKTFLIGSAMVATMGVFANEAIKFEDKMADVAKTTGLSDDKLAQFGDSILEMSKKTRTSIDDLASIAEIGGQLGIAEKDLIKFTNSADKFNIALGEDFGGVEEAVSQVGKIKELFSETRDIDIAQAINRTGSAINELGAVGAGTSSNITDFTLRLGALPDALKPSVENTLALGTLLEEVGINSKIGASGLSKILLVASSNTAGFAKQMGVTNAEVSNLLSNDPTTFLKLFSKSFNDASPEELSKGLKDLGINSQEAIKVLGALGSGTERLTELQEVASNAFSQGTSLLDEAAKKNGTTAAQMAMAENNMKALSITLGNSLIPIINELLQAVTPVIDSFSKWVKNNPELVSTIARIGVKIAGLMFAISGISAVVGIFAKGMSLARYAVIAYNVVMKAFSMLTGIGGVTMGAMNKSVKLYSVGMKIATIATKVWGVALKVAAGPIGWIILGVGALAAGIYGLSKAFSSQSKSERLAGEVRKRALENTIDQRVEVTLLFKSLRKAEEGSQKYNDTLKRLEEIQPGIIEKYNLTAKSLEKINLAEKELISNIMKRAETEARAELMREKMKEALTIEQEGPGFFDYYLSAMAWGGVSAESLNQAEADALREEVDILANQQVEADFRESGIVSPDQATAEQITEKIEKQVIEVDFKNLPEGAEVSRLGRSGSGPMPKIGTTRG